MYPLLNCYPERRVQSQHILRHAWLTEPFPENYLMDYETHQKIRMEKYDLSEEKDEIHQYESEREDASSEDNNDKDDEDELYEI